MRARFRRSVVGNNSIAMLFCVVLGAILYASLAQGRGVRPPYLVTWPAKPPYPADWRVRGFGGAAKVDVWVNDAGGVDSARAISNGYAEVDSAVVRYALGCKFTPRPSDAERWDKNDRLAVWFSPPRSPNLIDARHRVSRCVGSTTDSTGQVRKLIADLTTVVQLDSVTGAYVYSYHLRNAPESQAKLVYLGVYPFDVGSIGAMEQSGVRAEGANLWPGVGLCSGRRDVMVWMSNDVYVKRGAQASGLKPGEELGPFEIVSYDLPTRGRWVAGGNGACGGACYPWAAECDIESSIRGQTFLPGARGRSRGVLAGVVKCVGPGPPVRPRVQVLGARRDTTFATCDRFKIGGLPVGAFRVRVTSPGYLPWEGWAEVASGERTLSVELTPEPTNVK